MKQKRLLPFILLCAISAPVGARGTRQRPVKTGIDERPHRVNEIRNKAEFDMLITRDAIKIVKLYSPTCPHCRTIKKIFENLSIEHPDLVFIAVNTTTPDGKTIGSEYNVTGVPTFIIVNQAGTLVGNPLKGSNPDAIKQLPLTARTVGNKTEKRPAKTEPEGISKSVHTTAPSGTVIEISSTTEFDKLIKQDGIKLVKFSETNCPPCKTIKPVFEALAKQNTDIRFVSVNLSTPQTKEIGNRYTINRVPTFISFDQSGNQIGSPLEGANQNKVKQLPESARKMTSPSVTPAPEKPITKPVSKKATQAPTPATTGTQHVIDICSAAELKQQLGMNKYAILLFTRPTSCPPCKDLDPDYRALPENPNYQNYLFLSVETDKPGANSIKKEYGITDVPTAVFISKDGTPLETMVGPVKPMIEDRIRYFFIQENKKSPIISTKTVRNN